MWLCSWTLKVSWDGQGLWVLPYPGDAPKPAQLVLQDELQHGHPGSGGRVASHRELEH